MDDAIEPVTPQNAIVLRTDSGEEMRVDDLYRDAWLNIVEHSQLGDRMRRALMRICCGQPIREAAHAEGYKTHRDLYTYAKKWGLVDLKTRAMILTKREVSFLADEELKRRLLDKPEKISDMVLNAISGTAADKVIAHEKNSTDDGRNYLSALEKVAAQVMETGQGIEIKLAIHPTRHNPEPIDVTPEPAHDIG